MRRRRWSYTSRPTISASSPRRSRFPSCTSHRSGSRVSRRHDLQRAPLKSKFANDRLMFLLLFLAVPLAYLITVVTLAARRDAGGLGLSLLFFAAAVISGSW